MIKRGLVFVLLFLFAFTAGAVAATTALKVTVNGVPVTFRTEPKFKKNVLMVPLEDLVKALGIEARWNVGTNTLEITDPRAAKPASAPAQAGTTVQPAQPSAPTPLMGWEEAAEILTEKYGVYAKGDRRMRISWSLDQTSPGDNPVIMAHIAEEEYANFVDLKGPEMLSWFKEASGVVARVFPKKATVALLWQFTYPDYPWDKHDYIDLTLDTQYMVTDIEIWSTIADGSIETMWDQK